MSKQLCVHLHALVRVIRSKCDISWGNWKNADGMDFCTHIIMMMMMVRITDRNDF